jgi:hypothetical protein
MRGCRYFYQNAGFVRLLPCSRICCRAKFSDLNTMVNSTEGDTSVTQGEKKAELVLPVFAEDLASNVRAGFDSTCELILQSHAALTAQITQLATRIDALGDAPAHAPVQPPPAAPLRDVVQRRPADNHDRRLLAPADDGDLQDDAHYIQRPFAARPAGALREQLPDRDRFGHAARVPLDDGGLGRIKLSIPPFSGDRGPEDYLEWEMRMDQIFSSYHYTEERRLQLAAVEFTGYVLIWWNQILRMRTRPTSWRGMKELMRHRFVPEHYKRDMHNKLQQLAQGTKSVDEYYKEMELLMIRTGTREDVEATMSRFLNGLNFEVRDRVEMVYYNDLQDLVHQAERAEQQIKRRQAAAPANSWRRSHTEAAGSSVQPAPSTRSNHVSQSDPPKSGISKAASTTQSTANIQCFTCGGRGHMRRDCANAKRVMLTQDGYISASDDDQIDPSSEESEEHDNFDVYPGDVAPNCTNLMVQRVMADRIEGQGQRWNIFQTQCTVKNTACKLIIDGGSYTNIVSKRLVDSLSLPTWKHP